MKNVMQKNNITEKNLQKLNAKATDYLANRGYPTSGVVVFYNGKIQGWVNKLRDPQHWMPGCIAVTHGDSFYITTGGDDYNGAAQWEPISIVSKEPIATPKIGQYWEGQGGFYAGIMRDSERQWHLILSQAVIDAPWGKYPSEISGEFSRRDGLHNTKLILAADPENVIAKMTLEINIDGHSDFYWPAQCENNLLFNNIPERMAQERHWSSTQLSAHNAWIQYFAVGHQDINDKDISLAARAVRRLPI